MVSFGAMDAQKLKEVLELHRKCILGGEGGIRADLCGANLSRAYLSRANLCGAYLSRANLCGANLSRAYLSRADLSGADLSGADLSGADLSGAYLSRANLSRANLSGADLSEANLSGANLSGAYLRGAHLPSPTMVLLASWERVSNDLCTDLMNYDAACHGDPEAFERWAVIGRCPYDGVRYQRAAGFYESRALWNPKRPLCRPFDLMVRCIREKCKDSDYHDLPGDV